MVLVRGGLFSRSGLPRGGHGCSVPLTAGANSTHTLILDVKSFLKDSLNCYLSLELSVRVSFCQRKF